MDSLNEKERAHGHQIHSDKLRFKPNRTEELQTEEKLLKHI